MPFNGSGTFSRVYNWVTDKNNSINITASRADTEDTGFATGLTNCICRDGQTTITANLPMSGFAHTGVANATARTQYAVVGQIQDSTYNWIAGGGTADAITATYAPAVTALVDGMELNFRATAANATTTPTFAPNGLTARTITKKGGAALAAGDIFAALAEYTLRYNLANTRWELLNPTVVASAGTVSSVGLSTNASYLTIGSTPVTGSGTITANKTTGLTANQFVGTPNGSTGTADLRSIVYADLPAVTSSQSNPSNPTGSSNATATMQGLAGSITPTTSGRVLVIISGSFTGAGGGASTAAIQIRYGTGSAPANAAATTGTAVGVSVSYNEPNGGSAIPFSIQSTISSLTPSTAYWLDLSLSSSGGILSSLKDITITAIELK